MPQRSVYDFAGIFSPLVAVAGLQEVSETKENLVAEDLI
jgi:hypothetical protein